MTLHGLWLGGIFSVPALVLLGLVQIWAWRLKKRGERTPVSEKLLRPAGETLRLRIDKLNGNLAKGIACGITVPWVGFALFLAVPIPSQAIARFAVASFVALGSFSFFTTKLFRTARELRNCNLGFFGERAVGEEINQLMLQGCRVYHDVPMEPYGNIDHVIVAPSGVYAVETKTRRKKRAPAGKREHEVTFNGKELEYPHGADTHGIDQARQQADRLRVLLSKAVGEPVATVPILTLPGWYVKSLVNGALKVVNPKGIRHVVVNGQPPILSPQLMQRISHQLDQKCRDVEM